jgi:quercetin dioxygenase-like cupin family protein
MGEFTRMNLEEVEDSAPKFGMAPALEAHFANRDLGVERSGISFQRLEPNARVPFGHRHKEQEELYVVVEGSGRIALDDEAVELRRLDAVRIPPETMRCLEAGPDGLGVVLFGAPARGPDDVEMEQGWWGPDSA